MHDGLCLGDLNVYNLYVFDQQHAPSFLGLKLIRHFIVGIHQIDEPCFSLVSLLIIDLVYEKERQCLAYVIQLFSKTYMYSIIN